MREASHRAKLMFDLVTDLIVSMLAMTSTTTYKRFSKSDRSFSMQPLTGMNTPCLEAM